MIPKDLKFSLIMPTLNRREELDTFLKSLINQTYTNYELIIIDQNRDNLIDDLVLYFREKISLVHIKSETLGLSYNRNLGLNYARGELICFPDDDCEYPPDLLQKVVEEFSVDSNMAILTGSTFDKSSGSSYLKSPKNLKRVYFYNVFSTGISFTIFVNTLKCPIYRFDNRLGVGSLFGSSEETDFLIRYLNNGFRINFNPNIVVYHPVSNSNESYARAFNYALGFGAIHRKYSSHYYGFYLLRYFIHLFVNFTRVIFFIKPKRNFFILKGKLLGFRNYQ